MEVLLPHRVEYLVDGQVSVDELIDSLCAQQRIVSELGELIELVLDGVSVEKAELRVKSITSGSLKEAFFVALFLTYQEELNQVIPPIVELWLGTAIHDQYDALVTVGVIFLLYYGADYAYKRFTDHMGSARLSKKLDEFASELAHASGKPLPQIRRLIEEHFGSKSKMKELSEAAVKFFRPSRNQENGPILIGDRRLDPDDIRDVPNQVNLTALDAEEHSVPFPGTRIELRAKDQDHEGSGWGGIVRTISDKRKPVRLFPDVSKDFLWENDTVWADILVTYRTKPGGQEPVRYHIMRILDGPPRQTDGSSDI